MSTPWVIMLLKFSYFTNKEDEKLLEKYLKKLHFSRANRNR